MVIVPAGVADVSNFYGNSLALVWATLTDGSFVKLRNYIAWLDFKDNFACFDDR